MDEMIAYLFSPAAQIALIIGLAELAKKIGFPTRFVPLLDLVLGMISGVVVFGFVLGYGVAVGIILGIAMGLSACGLFSGIKNVAEGVRAIADRSDKGEDGKTN